MFSNSLHSRSEHALGNFQKRSAAGWGWMRTRSSHRSQAELQRLVDFCCETITDDQDRLDAVSEGTLLRLLGVLPASVCTVRQWSRKPINNRQRGAASCRKSSRTSVWIP